MWSKWTTLKKLVWFYMLKGVAAILETVTGTAPITLTDAIRHALISLTQTGKCAQASTPTPSSPVDIKCNNGKIVARRQSGLPTGYKLIESMTLNNNCYYEITDFPMYGSDTLKFSFSIMADCNVIGAYSGSVSGDNYSLYCVTQNGNYMRYGSGAYRSALNSYTRYDATITPTGSYGLLFNSTWAELTFTTPTNLCIGSTSSTTTAAKFRGTFYGAIEVVGRAKFLPCERSSDGVVGWYDLYSDTFYAPVSGSTNPIKGSYVDDSVVEVVVIGTDEVLTVGGKNLLDPAECGAMPSGFPSSGRVGWSLPLPAGSFTISKNSTSSDGSRIFYRISTDGGTSWSYYTEITSGSVTSTGSATITQGAAFVLAVYSAESTSTIAAVLASDVMVEIGSTATTYEPYVTPQTASAENLLSVAANADTQEIISGLVTHRAGVKVLTGDEGWNVISGTPIFYTIVNDMKICNPVEVGLSTHFTGTSAATSSMPDNSVKNTYAGGGTLGAIAIKHGASGSETQWKQFLAAQFAAGTPVIVVYPLATPTTEDVTPQHLETAEGDNTISVTAEVSGIELKAEYRKTAA